MAATRGTRGRPAHPSEPGAHAHTDVSGRELCALVGTGAHGLGPPARRVRSLWAGLGRSPWADVASSQPSLIPSPSHPRVRGDKHGGLRAYRASQAPRAASVLPWPKSGDGCAEPATEAAGGRGRGAHGNRVPTGGRLAARGQQANAAPVQGPTRQAHTGVRRKGKTEVRCRRVP